MRKHLGLLACGLVLSAWLVGCGESSGLHGRQLPGNAVPFVAGESIVSPYLQAMEKPVVLVFFATWCGACKHHTPTVNAFRQWSGERCDVYLVTQQNDAAATASYLKRYADPDGGLAALVDQGAVFAHALNVRAIPLVVGVAKGGRIAYVEHELPGRSRWDDFLATLQQPMEGD